MAAYRLAEAGRSVVLLERGKAYPPGSFARTPAAMGRAFWDPSEGLQGLFDVWTFRGLEGVVSSGLGGGSLIYANVLLRKDEKWFVHEAPVPGGGYESWPLSRADLDPHYDRVEQMLGATPLPLPGHHAEDRRDAGQRRPARARLAAAAARRDLRRAARATRPVPGAPIPTAAVRQPARPAAQHLPAVRRVRHRLQRRREEHPRPHLPVGRRPPRRGPAHPVRGARRRHRCPAAATRCATSCTTRPTRAARPRPAPSRCTGSPATGWCSAPAPSARRYLLLRNRVAFPGPEPDPGHAVLRQRRPARRSCSTRPTRRPTAAAGASRAAADRSSPAPSGSGTRSTGTGRPAAATTSRTPATRCSPTGWWRASQLPGPGPAARAVRPRPAGAGGSAGHRRPASRRTSAR